MADGDPCSAHHSPCTIVLTGGPSAGKTAVLELVRHLFCHHVQLLPEAASLLFRGGFPRASTRGGRQATQRAIFVVQRELEAVLRAEHGPAIVVADRGTVDGWAYWPDDDDFWAAMHTTRARELARYDRVIHLRTPGVNDGYNHDNPARLETAAEAARIDARIAEVWSGHPRYVVVDNAPQFLAKAERALEELRRAIPDCWRGPPPDRAGVPPRAPAAAAPG